LSIEIDIREIEHEIFIETYSKISKQPLCQP